jgi:type VI secretion system protein ImpJ
MSAYSKVIWSEGLFLRPQHFQQQDRYFERYVEGRCHALAPHSWGFTDIEIERDLLAVGKLAVRRAAGVFPDGTPFRMPEDGPLPSPYNVAVDDRDVVVQLAVPLRRPGARDVDRTASPDDLLRHDVLELETCDATSSGTETALLEVGAMRTRLSPAAGVTAACACLPVAHIVERRADGQVVLDEMFIPTVLDVRASRQLTAYVTELAGLLHQRGEAIGGVGAEASLGASAELADVLRLQVINGLEPIFMHFAESGALHPEALYRQCLSAAGELATFTLASRRPPSFPPYRHDALRTSFEPVVALLRRMLSTTTEQMAIPVPIDVRRFGTYVGLVGDRTLYSTASFVLAARASMPAEELRRRLPAQLKVGPEDKLHELVHLGLPGISVHALPVAPRPLPFHSGFAYFELDRHHPLWTPLSQSAGVGLHVAGEFKDLALELWAVRTPREA